MTRITVLAFLAAATAFCQDVVTLPAGAWVSIRVNHQLSSSHNQAGDAFMATLAEPLIANGIVVARRGQTVMGRVVETTKSGRVKGTARMALEVVEIGLVDGQIMPVRTQFVESVSGTSKGRDAEAVLTTTGAGAAVGAVAAGGAGAGLGAIAGAGASMIGVLVTRGRSVEIYPEDLLTFRTQAPIDIHTEKAAHAFLPVRQEDYASQRFQSRPVTRLVASPTPYYWDPFWGPGLGYGWGYGWGPRWGYYGRPGPFVGVGGFRRIR